MKTILVHSIALLLLLSGCRQKPNDSADSQAIRKSVEEYGKAINSRNPAGVASIMTERTYYAVPNTPAVTGKDAVKNQLKSMFDRFASYDLDFRAPVSDIQVRGDLATARGSWSMRTSPRSGGAASMNENGSWTVISRRQNDGTWKWDSLTANSEQPLPGTSANGNDENELIQIEQNMAAEMINGQAAGQIQRRAQALGTLSKSYQLTSINVRDLSPRVFGDAALVQLTGDVKGIYYGKDTSGSLHGVDFFVRRDGRWQLAYSQNTVSIP